MRHEQRKLTALAACSSLLACASLLGSGCQVGTELHDEVLAGQPSALLLRDGQLARQVLVDPLPDPVFVSLPHPVAAAHDAHPSGSILYGVLGDEGLELWTQHQDGQQPVRLAPAALSARFLPGARVAYLSADGVLVVDGAGEVAVEVSAFGVGPDGTLFFARDDRATTGPGLWQLDDDGGELLLSTSGLTGIWSARYAPAADPTGTRLAFLAGDAGGVSVLEIDLRAGSERVLSAEALPPIEALSYVGPDWVVLSGLGMLETDDAELLALEVTGAPNAARRLGAAVVAGVVGDRALVFAEEQDEDRSILRRDLVEIASAGPISAMELPAARVLPPGVVPEFTDEVDEYGVIYNVGFYGVKFSRPLTAGTPTSYFSHGTRRFDCACNGASCRSGHRGTDIAAARGTRIHAAAAGTVGTVVTGCVEGNHSCGGGFGNYVRLVHANGHSTYYAHMTRVDKHSGGAACHAALGTVGNTGHSYGAHVHFEVRTASNGRIDPFHGSCNNTVNQSLWLSQGGASPAFTCGGGGGGTPPGGTTVKGIVYRGTDTSRRIAGATVKLGTRTATTDASGYYQFGNVAAGTHTITASASGYQTRSISRAVSGAETWGSIGLSPSTSTGTATVVGIIHRGGDSASRIGGATVRLSNGRTATADGSGVYRFTAVTPGTYTITASAPGYQDGSISRAVSAPETWGSIGLSPTGGTAILQGVIYRGSDPSNRVGGATVQLSGGRSMTADGNGFYQFTGLASGTYTVTASRPGVGTGSVSRTIDNGTTTWGSVSLP